MSKQNSGATGFDELKKHFVHTGVINAFVYQAKLLERFQSESE